MAVLDKKPYPFPAPDRQWSRRGPQDAAMEKLQDISNALRPGQIVGGLVSFPAADGYAIYVVTKEKPLTLAHVPFGDGWTVSDAHIRGLRRSDIEVLLERSRAMQRLFGGKK